MSAFEAAPGLSVTVEAVTFSYGETGFCFDAAFEAGAVTAVMGASGSGKSTLLNLIAGFVTPSSGRILAGTTDITALLPAARPLSMIFQENNLFAHLDVAANVGLGISPSLRLADGDRRRIAGALARTGLAGKERRYPAELSGGERQRVAIARALVRDKPILLLDEAFVSLGPALRAEMLELVAEVQREKRMTIVLVSHDPADALRIASRVVFLEHGQVAMAGTADAILGGDAPEAVRRYIGNPLD